MGDAEDLAEAKAEIDRLLAEAADQERRWQASHEYARISEYRRRTRAAEAELAEAKAQWAAFFKTHQPSWNEVDCDCSCGWRDSNKLKLGPREYLRHLEEEQAALLAGEDQR